MAARLTVPELEPFIIPSKDVTPTGRELGRGAYGSVEEVEIPGALCAAKKLHDQLIQLGSEQQVDRWIASFVNECKLASKVRHPNIVQFLGVCYLPGSNIPVLLMEKLAMSLDELLEKEKNIPHDLKVSMLFGVSCGLVFLHSQDPPIVHRDLTARNILLDSALIAKIADLGVARMVTIKPGKLAATMTQAPGNIIYMPPEAMGKEGTHYNAAIDIFSFGNVALFTITQVFQDELLAASYFDPTTRMVMARTETERRSQYIDILHEIIGKEHSLSKLILQCLEYLPEERPSAIQVLDCLKEVRTNTPQEWDMTKLELIHCVKQGRNQHSLEEHQQQLAVKQAVIDEKEALIDQQRNIISEQQETIDTKEAAINEKQEIIDLKDIVNRSVIEQLQQESIKLKDELQEELLQKQKCIDDLRAELLQKQSAHVDTTNNADSAKKISASSLEVGQLHDVASKKQVVVKPSGNSEAEPKKKPQKTASAVDHSLIKFKWTFKKKFGFDNRGGDWVLRELPRRTELVVINGSVFGGGVGQIPWEYSLENDIVIVIDLLSPAHSHYLCYNLVNIDNQLIAVTGFRERDIDCQTPIEEFTLRKVETGEIAFPQAYCMYGSCAPTCIVYKDFLIVAGGFERHHLLGPKFVPEVYIFNITTSEWVEASKLPLGSRHYNFSAAIINDTLFLIDGIDGVMFKADLQHLPYSDAYSTPSELVWQNAASAPPNNYSPVVIERKFILIFTNGLQNDSESSSSHSATESPSVYLYDPGNDQWRKMGNFLEGCKACTILPTGELFAVGENYIRRATLEFNRLIPTGEFTVEHEFIEPTATPKLSKKSFWSRLRK